MTSHPRRLRLRLRHILFLALLLVGIVPMLVSSFLLVSGNRELLEDQERELLVNEALARSQVLGEGLVSIRKQLTQMGAALLAASGNPEGEGGAVAMEEAWVERYLTPLARENPGEVLAVTVFDREGRGLAAGDVTERAQRAIQAAYLRAMEKGEAVYEFGGALDGEPVAAVTVPVGGDGEAPGLVVAALVDLTRMASFLEYGEGGDVDSALLDSQGRVLWSQGLTGPEEEALAGSTPVRLFTMRPMSQISQYELEVEGERREMLVQIAPVAETGWALAAQKPESAAFQAADELVFNTLMASLLVVLLALVLAAVAARRVSDPVQKLAATSHEIAEGNFGRRVEVEGLTTEFSELAADFNRMSGHVERYVEELKRAAQANRELFIGSLRAFAAAIDAKDPYTRGHSERVATLSRTIARHLGVSDELQHRVWIAALLHDVGKIGVDDQILKKSGVLTDEEFTQMKAHTVIGAEILSPIVELREMVPAVRWHHENWNGRGYPDGLKGEQIPLLARIVAVADTFDAVTTNRPYQQAYSLPDAVATIRRLVGSRFDAKIVTAFLHAHEQGEIRLPRRPGQPRAAVGA